MKETPIYFTDEKWDKIEKELLDIKMLLTRVLAAVDNRSANEDDPILSARDVARQLSVDVGTIYTKCIRKEIPHFKVGNRYKFRQSEINRWLESTNDNPQVDIDEYVNRYLQKNVIKA